MSRATTAAALLAAALLAPAAATAQEIGFAGDLPRTLVFIAERGEGDVATRDMVGFLREAGFPLVDPALAHTAAQRELVQAALAGDEGAAVELGRDFGAQLLLLGRADWGARPDPLDQSAITGTAEVEVRALRLDDGTVVGTARGEGRKLEATEQAARTAAIRQATRQVLTQTALVGQVLNNWSEQAWSEVGYFQPDPGSVGAALERSMPGGAAASPRLAILSTGIAPPDAAAPASRGIGVFRRGEEAAGLVNRVQLDGVVVGDVTDVQVEGVAARLEALAPALAAQLGVGAGAKRFSATTMLPVSRDTLRVVARGVGGGTAEALAAPRVNRRWAVIIGIGEYESGDIPDLAYAGRDAQAFHEFLRSEAAGPFPEENILFLRDGQATGQAMREALFVFLQQAAWDDLVVIYFAGHGAPDPNRPENLYLLPADADMDALAATGFPMWDVKTALRRQIAAERVVVIADACHSGGTGEGANPINGSFAELFTPSRRLTLTAADAHELSFEDARWGGGHGVFTYNLLEGLKGGADADADGIVTFTEAASWVAGRVGEETDGRQNPQRTGLGDVPLALVPVASGGGQ